MHLSNGAQGALQRNNPVMSWEWIQTMKATGASDFQTQVLYSLLQSLSPNSFLSTFPLTLIFESFLSFPHHIPPPSCPSGLWAEGWVQPLRTWFDFECLCSLSISERWRFASLLEDFRHFLSYVQKRKFKRKTQNHIMKAFAHLD